MADAGQPAAQKGDAKGGEEKPKGAKKEKKVAKKGLDVSGASTYPLLLDPQPDFLAHRLAVWDRVKARRDAEQAAQPRAEINVTMPDGKVIKGTSFETTPLEIATGISKGLADQSVISKVDGVLWDLVRPLERDCSLTLLKFDNDEAKAVFWHSSAHVLGEAMECHYGGLLCYGPPIEQGYFYDMMYKDPERTVRQADFDHLDTLCSKITKEKQPFERLELTKEELLEMFKYNEFKCRIINERITTPTTTAYRCGPLIDLCRGPHVPHTGRIKCMSVTKTSSAYWEGKADKEVLSRVYGISFPDKKQLAEYKKFQKEAAERDHRKIGIEQELFFFNDVSPGSCFFLPHGARIYNALLDFLKQEYRRRGFSEVITPNIYNSKLWETSGHWEHYQENMFLFEVENEKFGLKPMNCPGHCMMFAHRTRSWRELPLRMADFGVLHRNELSGALTGLIRVRRFQQDDAHIFCTHEQIESEINGCLDFLRHVYSKFGFTFKMKLSTRPEGFLGEVAVWDDAERALESALNRFGEPWELNPGDGAFYGPKIDITILDALRRSHQCATIQLDFQQPIRFNLSYKDANGGTARPVIVHRAILGSAERMIAILTESFGGKWPFWLSPRQACIVPVDPKFYDYAYEVRQLIHDAGFFVEVDDHADTLKKKIRNAQLAKNNYIFVVGAEEVSKRTVNVRTRDNEVHGEKTLDEVLAHFRELGASRARDDTWVAAETQAAVAAVKEA